MAATDRVGLRSEAAITSTRRYGERRITAFMEDPDNMNIVNVIHANQGAREYGYKAALVGGVIVYGWAIPAVLQAFGADWLARGWADVSFRRPTYPGDELVARVGEHDDGSCELTITNQDGEVCVSGEVGIGDAAWLAELTLPAELTARPRPDSLPRLTLANAPVGRDLRPMAVPISRQEATAFALDQEADADPLWAGERALVHPGWLAGRMTRLMHHSYDYGPSIHTRSQIQNLAAVEAGQTLAVAGRFVDAFERKGHHYAVVDGLIVAEDGRHLCRLRHTTIFEVARRPAP
jgi:acyl dehydratase